VCVLPPNEKSWATADSRREPR